MSSQFSLEINSFLEVEKIQQAMDFDFLNWWAIKILIFLPTFSMKLDCFPVYPVLLLEDQGWPIVPICYSDAKIFPLTWRCLFLDLLEWHFLGHLPFMPLKICWNISSVLGFLQCCFASLAFASQPVGKQLGNGSFIQMCQIEYWINKVYKCLLSNSSRFHTIWFCIQERDTSPFSLRLSM